MKSVGVRELKATLSEQLKDVQRGEVVLVTDRGRVVAEIHAPGTASSTHAPLGLAPRLQAWIRDGRASIDDDRAQAAYPASGLRLAAGTAKRLVDELRGES